jgi:2-polyprenyl-3-methyl-5-hydroxy-6-metoxy-1,4-benzoquinol methylase
MSSTSVSILVPLLGRSSELPSTIENVERYLQTTGFAFDIRVLDSRDGAGYGAMLRRGVSDAKGSVVVIIDPEMPYAVGAIGDAVAMITSASTDIVFATHDGRDESRHASIRSLLVPILPDPAVHLEAYSSDAARLLFGESKLTSGAIELELAYIANKYGFRVERLRVDAEPSGMRTFAAFGGLVAAMRIRLIDRNNGYRAARRCPICFSTEVWSCAQVPGNIVRACNRCKCRYLNQYTETESQPVRRVLRAHPPVSDALDETQHSSTARQKTAVRRIDVLRDELLSRARVLEIGVRDGSFGAVASREFEYVGLDPVEACTRQARARGLEVYCSNVAGFVNTGPAFDAVAVFHVLENMADPHDSLARLHDLLKPGGVLLLTTFDTEGMLYLMTERKRMVHNFRKHVILYSRSALIELLERSGFEIAAVGPDYEYRDHKFLRHWVAARWPSLAAPVRVALRLLPDPLLVSSGSIRILAKRRAGPPAGMRPIRSVEPTHAR